MRARTVAIHPCVDQSVGQADHVAQARSILQPRQRRLGTQIPARVRQPSAGQLECRIGPQMIEVVGVLIAAANREHPHQALHAENKWQGRALHSDRPSGMGLCPGLPNIRSSGSRAAGLAASIQLAPPPWWYRLSNADQQARFDQGQPLEAPHLAHGL